MNPKEIIEIIKNLVDKIGLPKYQSIFEDSRNCNYEDAYYFGMDDGRSILAKEIRDILNQRE